MGFVINNCFRLFHYGLKRSNLFHNSSIYCRLKQTTKLLTHLSNLIIYKKPIKQKNFLKKVGCIVLVMLLVIKKWIASYLQLLYYKIEKSKHDKGHHTVGLSKQTQQQQQ